MCEMSLLVIEPNIRILKVNGVGLTVTTHHKAKFPHI